MTPGSLLRLDASDGLSLECATGFASKLIIYGLLLSGVVTSAYSVQALPSASYSARDLREQKEVGLAEAIADTPKTTQNPEVPPPATSPLDLDPQLIESSPVLQRWLDQVPDVLEDIKRDPSFRTRLRLGYSSFASSNRAGGWHVGLEDVFLGRTGLTLSADYQASFNGRRKAWGADLRYYVRPLGSHINLAPVLGYRHLETSRYTTEGLHVGARLLLVPSRTGAADISLTQSWVSPGTGEEVGLTTLSFGYALTRNLRLSTEIQKQNARQRKDSRVGIGLEWMF
ncbi:hypothetical protein [Leptothermofonsia sichuanensis]|uniref:hypothetical protein n=1 Tax=Leptothermofonsia sichuanensis TaxID=2917832 RepID=UPI001CEC3060|nr:hypothetical protein [Leptothermofonsia sichuanensis]